MESKSYNKRKVTAKLWKVELIVILVTSLIACCVVKIKDLEKQIEKRNEYLSCYKHLYNYDDLKEGCEKYFKTDDWYIKYELGKHH